MNRISKTIFFLACLACLHIPFGHAQEHLAPLKNTNRYWGTTPLNATPTGINLPFFDDFCHEGPYPNPNLWTNNYVWINTSMGIMPPTYGVATFDALNEHGTPYDTFQRDQTVWADSLTSVNINLDGLSSNDNVALTFYIQQQGYGFMPNPEDSFYVFFKNRMGTWQREFTLGIGTDSTFMPFRIDITDSSYFHENFAFMFVNKATIKLNNSNWHLDYVYLDTNRPTTSNDLNDIAFTMIPSTILTQYHAMPYRHFKMNPNAYLADNLRIKIANLSPTSQTIPYSHKIEANGAILHESNASITIGPYASAPSALTNVDANAIAGFSADTFTVITSYSLQDNANQLGFANNEITIRTPFSNYFAHDDGSPELFYFVSMHPSYNIPAYTAVKFTMEVPDTISGFSIFLPQMTPIGRNKEFGIKIFQEIAVNNGIDNQVYEQLFIYPSYNDTAQKMVNYRFDRPVLLPAGDFYLALMQPAGGFSDSLYVGLDVTNNVTQERYYSVTASWEPSNLPGALLFRPIVGNFFALSAPERNENMEHALLYPNPSKGLVHIKEGIKVDQIHIYNTIGKSFRCEYSNDGTIDMSYLPKGLYFISLQYGDKQYPIQKITLQ